MKNILFECNSNLKYFDFWRQGFSTVLNTEHWASILKRKQILFSGMERKAKEMNQNKTNLEFDNNTLLGPLEKPLVGTSRRAGHLLGWNLIQESDWSRKQNKTFHWLRNKNIQNIKKERKNYKLNWIKNIASMEWIFIIINSSLFMHSKIIRKFFSLFIVAPRRQRGPEYDLRIFDVLETIFLFVIL